MSRRAGISSLKLSLSKGVLPPDRKYVIAPGRFANLMMESPTIRISGHSVSWFPL